MSISLDLQTLRRPAQSMTEARQWWSYLPEMGRDAREWCQGFERFGTEISKRTGIVVRNLQRRKLESAWRVLEECRTELNEIETVAPRPVVDVVEVSYLSALAYYHYHTSELDTAREVLAKSVSRMEEAISLQSFLVPCAGQCYDYRLHLARIARAESRWDEMFDQIEIGRQMVFGELPLCHSTHGPVYLDDVCGFYRKVTPLNEIERETLALLGDPRTVQREYRNLCIAATIVPHIVVDWLGY